MLIRGVDNVNVNSRAKKTRLNAFISLPNVFTYQNDGQVLLLPLELWKSPLSKSTVLKINSFNSLKTRLCGVVIMYIGRFRIPVI